MKTAKVNASLLATVLLTALVTSCGQGSNAESQALAKYFREIGGSPETSSAFAKIDDQLQNLPADTTDSARIAAYADYFELAAPLLAQTAENLTHVEPPASVEDVHRGLVSVVSDMGTAMSTTAQVLTNLDSWSGAREVIVRELLPVSLRMGEICRDLRDLAAAHQVDLQYRCPQLPLSSDLPT